MDWSDSIESQIERVRSGIKQHELFAQYWIASATTGVAKSRKMSYEDGSTLSDGEKTKNALDTALKHIHSMGEMTETLIKLLEQR